MNIAEDEEFEYRDIYGPMIHKDEPSRQSQRGGLNSDSLVIDYLYVFRKWPGRSEEIKLQRQQLMMSVGVHWPIEWF